jgi:hypothetical protein
MYPFKDTYDLDDFSQWYYDNIWRKEGGQISYKDVTYYLREWLKSMEDK